MIFSGAPALLLLLAAIYFIWRTWIAHPSDGHERPEPELCKHCGYDLRATHDRCPECGTPVPTDADRALARGLLLNPQKLQNDWPAAPIDPRVPEPHETPVVVLRSLSGFEADLLIQQLNARGVLAKLQTKDQFLQMGYDSKKVSESIVVVPSGDHDLAEAIVDRFRLKPHAADTGQ